MTHKPRVLIVDDEVTNLEMLAALFRDDCSVIVARNGREALARADSPEQPDLILLDVEMPEKDGYQVCESLKGSRSTRDIPVIFLTARDDESDEARGLALGAEDYITKPFRPPIVRARVKNLLTRRQLKKDLERLQRDFTAMMVHDVRTPLHIIRSFAELALLEDDGSDPEPLRSALGRIMENADRARELIDQMLDVCQLRDGKMNLKRAPTDVTTLLGKIVADLRVMAGDKAIELRDELEPGLRADIDALKFTEVVSNLMANALKFTPAGGIVSVKAGAASGDTLEVAVTDTGPGIPADQLERLFAPWEHGGSSTKQTLKSFGLGLAISRMIVDAHGGKIEVESSPGAGATFRFSLPRAAPLSGADAAA